MVRAYWQLAASSFRRHLTYRAAAMAGLATNFFFGILRAYLFLTVLDTGAHFAGYSRAQLLAFTGWTQALIAFLMLFGWYELMETVRSGEIVGDLCRPVDLFLYWQSRDLGRSLQALLVRGLPLVLGYRLAFGMELPGAAATWGLFALSLLLAVLVSFAWRFAVNTIAFWWINARGAMWMASTAAWFLSGLALPVDVFPHWLQVVAAWSPFPAILHIPMQIVLGRLVGAAAGRGLLTQAGWLLTLWVLNLALTRTGIRKLVVQGG